MPRVSHDLAQVNIARLAFDLESPELADFVAQLDPVNALADAAPGFRWRLQGESGNATDIAAFAQEVGDGVAVITNLSTWADVASLKAFVYGPLHTAVVRRRRQWFLPIREAYTTCWWVPSGQRPTADEAEERLALLREHGPTPLAFTLREPFVPEDLISSR